MLSTGKQKRHSSKPPGMRLGFCVLCFAVIMTSMFTFSSKGFAGCNTFIGDFVWNDLNNDGFQDLGEPGIEGVTVTLENLTYGGTQTTDTNEFGYYEFTGNCNNRTYRIEVDESTLPAGFVATPCSTYSGSEEPYDLDSNCNGQEILLGYDENNPTIDFGYSRPTCSGSIGDYVWNDSNRDGIQDENEMGINGVEVLVTDSTGNQYSVTTFTGGPMTEPGYYLVDGLCADTYTVEVNPATVPVGMDPTMIEAGNDTVVDSNDPAGTTVVLQTDDSQDITIDFGYQTPCSGSIGDYVWNDADRDGIQDEDEMGIDGIQALVTDSAGNVHTVTTFSGGPMNQSGYYLVDGLCGDTYTVQVNMATVPMGMVPTMIEGGGDPTIDSNDPAGTTVVLTADNSQDISIDFGYYQMEL